MQKILFDTNALNGFLDKNIGPSCFPRGIRCCITAVQTSELMATQNENRRIELLEHFELLKDSVPVHRESLRSAPFGTSPFGQAPFGGGDGEYFAKIKNRLDCFPGNKSMRGNTSDALTLEVCIYTAATLVTNDLSLTAVAGEYGVPVLAFKDFLKFDAAPENDLENGGIV